MRIRAPYRPLVLKFLIQSYPIGMSKQNLCNALRYYFKDDEPYELLRFWDQLVDNDKLLNETNDMFSLNMDSLSDRQKTDLLMILKYKIHPESKSTEPVPSPTILKPPPSPTILKPPPSPTILKPSPSPSPTILKPSPPPSPTIQKHLENTKYYIVQFKKNSVLYDDRFPLQTFENHGLNLPPRQLRKLSFSSTENLIIFYDTKGDQIRVWGTAELEYLKQPSRNTDNIKFLHFEPLHLEGSEVVPKWLLKDDMYNSMFGNKQIIPILKKQFDHIVNSSVEESYFLSSSHSTTPARTTTNDAGDDSALTTTIDMPKTFTDDSLEFPSLETLEHGIEQIQKNLLIDSDTIKEIVFHLASKRHIILSGPIGTGKTELARNIPGVFWKKNDDDLGYNVCIYTATYDWNTNDVIAGIVPRMDNDKPIYQIQYGCVTETILKNWDDQHSKRVYRDKYRGTWVVIDEFNRADIDKVFGQLFTALETRELRIPVENSPDLKMLKIPQDYRIIGTMNTLDKHFLFKMSDALKRRFAIVEINAPKNIDGEKEIYYSLSNAIEELNPEDFTSFILLDDANKKINYDNSKDDIISAIKSIYEIFKFVRTFKMIGTGLLKSIYQTMLTGVKISNRPDDITSIVDITLNANLIPQLERIPNATIETLRKFCFDDVHSFFRSMYNSNDDSLKQTYSNNFGLYLQYIEFDNHQKYVRLFAKGSISDPDWEKILEKWKSVKTDLYLSAPMSKFKQSLIRLESSFDLT